jgi:hypothetical protein
MDFLKSESFFGHEIGISQKMWVLTRISLVILEHLSVSEFLTGCP